MNRSQRIFGPSTFSLLDRLLSSFCIVQFRFFVPSIFCLLGRPINYWTFHYQLIWPFQKWTVLPSWTVHFDPRPFTFGVISTMPSIAFVSTALSYFTFSNQFNFPTSIYIFNLSCSFPTSMILSKLNQIFPTSSVTFQLRVLLSNCPFQLTYTYPKKLHLSVKSPSFTYSYPFEVV